MIDYIQFTDPKGTDPKTLLTGDISHIPFLPSIRGKRFDFKPGLNLIVGPNAVGKTSLLSAIRRLYFAESEDGSVECVSRNLFSAFFNVSFPAHFDSGLFNLCEMKADYSKPLFSLRKQKDIAHHHIMDNVFSMLQNMESSSMSAGEGVSYALHALIATMQGKMPGARDDSYLDFPLVLDCIKRGALPLRDNDKRWAEVICRKVDFTLDWFKRNDIGARTQATAVLDEPDEGMDIYRLNSLLALLKAVAQLQRDQFIVSLHNVALVSALSAVEGVNVIELTPGYHKAMLDFGSIDDIGDGPAPFDQVALSVEIEDFRAALDKEDEDEGTKESPVEDAKPQVTSTSYSVHEPYKGFVPPLYDDNDADDWDLSVPPKDNQIFSKD